MNPNDPKGATGALKTPLSLIPPYAMKQMAWVHKLGATKYGAFNWRKTGVSASTYVNAMMRHLDAWRDGETLDPESGISHLAHIACSCNILLDADYCGTLQDDRNIPEFAWEPFLEWTTRASVKDDEEDEEDEESKEPQECSCGRYKMDFGFGLFCEDCDQYSAFTIS